MKYQKKPVVIEAWQLDSDFLIEQVPEWVRNNWVNGMFDYDLGDRLWHIKTLEGTMFAKNGDYLIQGVHGEIYSCKPDVFKETYSDIARLERNKERIITLDSYKDISLEIVLVNDKVDEYRVTGRSANGWSYWFTSFEDAVLSYFDAKLTNN